MTTGLIASTHGRFIGIQLVAPVCIQPNTCLLRPTRVHNPNGISIGSAVFAQLTQCRRGCPSMRFPLKIAHWRIRRSGPHLIHGSLAHPSPNPERHLDRFSRFCRAYYFASVTDRQTVADPGMGCLLSSVELSPQPDAVTHPIQRYETSVDTDLCRFILKIDNI